MYELHDRTSRRDIGRFRTVHEALMFIEQCVPASRIADLILGRQVDGGHYLIVSDGYQLRDRLSRA